MPEGNAIRDYKDWGYYVFENQDFSGFEDAVICVKKDYAIAVSLIHGNTRDRLTNPSMRTGLKRAYEMCNQAKYLYRVKYNKTYPVSTKSLAVELYLHAKPEAAVQVINEFTEAYPFPSAPLKSTLEDISDYFDGHCKFSDMGIRSGWKKQMDKIFDTVYDLIV